MLISQATGSSPAALQRSSLGSIPAPPANVTVASHQGYPIIRQQDMTRNEARYVIVFPDQSTRVLFSDTIGSTATRKVLSSGLFKAHLATATSAYRQKVSAQVRPGALGAAAPPQRWPTVAFKDAGTPPARWQSWIKEVFRTDDSQRVFYLRGNANDAFVRVVSNNAVVGLEPSSATVKYTIASLDSEKAIRRRPLNATVRTESSYLKTRQGTQLQFGRDASNDPAALRKRWADRGKPFLDLVSIEGVGDIALDRKRLEGAFEAKAGWSFAAFAQEAITLAGNVRWRRVWDNPKTGEQSGIDILLTAKAETAATAGVGGKSGRTQEAGIEVSVKYIGNGTKHIDPNWLARQGADALAVALVPADATATELVARNLGDPQRARRISTSQMVFGASPWQLARVSGGRNHGNAAVALAVSVNAVLRQHGLLGGAEGVGSTGQARTRLQGLWAGLAAPKKTQLARQLANPLSLNFGLAELDRANRSLYAEKTLPRAKFAAFRAFFRF